MVELFEAFWWGGQLHRYPEAAALANHYVHGKGKSLRIDSAPYQNSVIVKDTVSGIKAFVCDQLTAKRSVALLRSTDHAFAHSPQGRALSKYGGRNVDTQGYLVDGVLLAEQFNSRLKNTDNRFVLTAYSSALGQGKMITRWRVESKYDFEPLASASYYTNIPLAAGLVLRLPDGLSHYMTVLGIAAEFAYWAEWNDFWNA